MSNSKDLEKVNEELTIAVCGPVDAGKSTTIGVLTSNDLDDGRGLSRTKVLIHPHEKESGRTSNITFNPLIYKIKDKKLEHYIFNNTKGKNKSIIKNKEIELDTEVEENRERIVSFLDLAGHQKYLKTTVFGVTGLFPNYGIVVIGSNTGITKLTREHIGILFYLNIPFIICITKIDLTPKHVYQQLCNRIKQLLSNRIYQKICYFISDSDKNNEETSNYIKNLINNSDIVPIISISNKDGRNINNLHKILSHIKIKEKWCNNKQIIENNGSIVYIDSTFLVPGIGLVVSGSVKGKSIKVKDKLYLGPNNGVFYPVTVRSIHNTICQNVNEANSDSTSCFAIKFINSKNTISRKDIKKGMVLIDDLEKWKENVVSEFKAEITVLQHSTTIKSGYSPIIHCGPIRQTARLELCSDDTITHIRSGDTQEVYLKYLNHPEFMEDNNTFFFMDGNGKLVNES